jgi:hypothetical protein
VADPLVLALALALGALALEKCCSYGYVCRGEVCHWTPSRENL